MSTSPVLKASRTLVQGVPFYEIMREVTPEDTVTEVQTRKAYDRAEMVRSVYVGLKPGVLKELQDLMAYVYGPTNSLARVDRQFGEISEPIRTRGVHKDNKELRTHREAEAVCRLEDLGSRGGDKEIIDNAVRKFNESFRYGVGRANEKCISTIRQALRNSWADLDKAAGVAKDLADLASAQMRVEELKRLIRDKRAAAFLEELEKDSWSVTFGDDSTRLPEAVCQELRMELSKEGRAFRDNTVMIRTEA